MPTDLLKDLLKLRWVQIRAMIQRQWGHLTEDELDSVAGDYDKLVSVLQEKYGYSPERAAEEVQQCVSPYERATD